MAERTCSERGCREEPHCRGLCEYHYGKAYREGNLQLLLFAAVRHSLSNVDRGQKTAICAICGPVKVRFRTDRSPECMTKRRESAARWNAKNPQRASGPWPERSPEERWRESLKWQFGITPADYLRMLDEQGGVCAICHRPQEECRLAVDHDHRCCAGERSCGKCVRGLLCRTCNLALGCVRDDPAILGSAIDYLTSATVAIAS